ncbi:MAG: AMP-binding protein [Uliginosibacterium sp.]|nr:AMP-binding protein [Uliginosibacterium sp.]
MSFWLLDAPPEAPALIGPEPTQCVSYGELARLADDFVAALPARGGKRLGFILCQNDVASVAAYLGALRSGDCVALLPARISAEALAGLVARYAPDWIVMPEEPHGMDLSGHVSTPWLGKTLQTRPAASRTIFADTALLLSTSGSTGSPKMVRLSYANLSTNAESIASFLGINSAERAITSLPIHYSYGLSVLNSHLARGAAILLTDEAVTTKPFWTLFREAGATSLAGVPFTWQMLQRLRIERMDLPSLRTLTQAGGRLAPELIRHFAQISRDRGWRFFVMYGQTEATARIAWLPPERLADKLGAIGIAIPGGAISLDASGELIYRGPNVMLGYAESAADLALGDVQGGVLATGDLARIDEDGVVWLTGRSKRIAKVFGNRVNLDEVEALLESRMQLDSAAIAGDDKLLVAIASDAPEAAAQALALLREALGVHPSGLDVRGLNALPLTASGKKDYPAVQVALAARRPAAH